MACLDVNTNGAIKEEPAPVAEAPRGVDKEPAANSSPAPNTTPVPMQERTNDRDKEKNERDRSGMYYGYTGSLTIVTILSGKYPLFIGNVMM